MINKLKTKVSLIILFAISVPLIIIISLYTFSYYKNTIQSNVGFVDRFFEPKGPDKKFDITEMSGIYSVLVNNNKIVNISNNTTKKIENYAKKVTNKSNEEGIIGNYIS